MMTFWPPAWQAAQLAENTCSPAPTSPARTAVGRIRAAAVEATAAWGREGGR